MPSVYVETSIPSFYFETRQSIRARDWREATRLWWSTRRDAYELVTSTYVLDELALAPAAKSGPGRRLLADVRVLPEHPDTARTIAAYVRQHVMPADAAGDAAHLAAASLHGIDFLVTWNCRHLANANKFRHIRAVNERLGLHVPILTTPLALMSESTS
jgi:predicted nucleic acid-binding protein